MKLSDKQKKELIVWEYFIPKNCDWQEKTDRDIEMFFEWSEQGKHKDLASIHTCLKEGRTYFNALVWGKKMADINIHELWEPSMFDVSWQGYINLLKEMPREVIEYVSKEMFKGIDKEIILSIKELE